MSFTELKGHISCEVRTRDMLRRFAQNQKSSLRTAIMIATPSHGNLGDQAIVYAQKRFLADALPGFSVFEIQRYQYELARESIQGMVRPSDIVVVDGGGNVGTLWPEENDKINDIVSRFVDCSVLVFPQTAYFEDSERGQECERETATVYRSNPNLVYFSRDRRTFETIGKLTPDTPNYYVPDIVPYINDAPFSTERSGALLCLRADKERALDDEAVKRLIPSLSNLGFRLVVRLRSLRSQQGFTRGTGMPFFAPSGQSSAPPSWSSPTGSMACFSLLSLALHAWRWTI